MAKKKKAKDKAIEIEKNITRYVSRLTEKQAAIVARFNTECLEGDKKKKHFLKELASEKDRELIRELVDVAEGKIKVKLIGARDLADLWRRNYSGVRQQTKRDEPVKRYEPVIGGFAGQDSPNRQQVNQPQEPEHQQPEYQEPVNFDDLIDELDNHSDEINKYLDGV